MSHLLNVGISLKPSLPFFVYYILSNIDQGTNNGFSLKKKWLIWTLEICCKYGYEMHDLLFDLRWIVRSLALKDYGLTPELENSKFSIEFNQLVKYIKSF